MRNYKELLASLFDEVERLKGERLSAGTRYRLMGLTSDVMEVTGWLKTEVLERVKQEAVVDVDVDMDYAEMSEQVLAMESVNLGDAVAKEQQLVNDALEQMSRVLAMIDDQIVRRHKDEEYVHVYEQEKRRYLSSGTARRARQTFDQWQYEVCNGKPTLENINDYVTEKLVHMFEKGVFNAKVEHIQRATRYPNEFDFSQLDDDYKLKKMVHKHYSELRKLVDYRDGFLIVDAVKLGRHFYANRKEENAKAHRNALLKYMHKIDMAQQERNKLLEPTQAESEDTSLLPGELATGMAMKYWRRLQAAGFVDETYQLLPTTSRKQAMYIADVFSDKLQMRSKWKPFQELWHINNLAQEKWDMQETGKMPVRSEEIDVIFDD